MQDSGVRKTGAVALGAGLAVAFAGVPACARDAPSSPPSTVGATAGATATALPTPAASGPAAGPAGGAARCTATAAERQGWGAPTRESDFSGTTLPPDWHPYGPEPGHEQRGLRTPAAITVADGEANLTGTADGTTGAMSWHPGQRYGRWELCVRSDPGNLHAVALLWPVAEDWPTGGEIDWMEIPDPDRQSTDFVLHSGPDNDMDGGDVRNDATRWTSYALEWTPRRMTAFVNGRPWWSSTDTRAFPPRPMVMTVQLDYFGDPGASAMHVDRAQQWALPSSEPATLSLAPGDPATGQPDLEPARVPRVLTP